MTDQSKGAREGEVVGWRWRFDNDLSESMWFYGHVIPERPENAINTIVETQPLYTHPAAPSADKLRDGVIDAAKTVVLEAWTDRHGRLHGHASVVALDQALAALKAEGA